MTKIYLTALMALGILTGTVSAKDKNIAFITQWGYLKIIGVDKDGYYQHGSLEDQSSYRKHTELQVPQASLIYTIITYHAKALGIPMPAIFLDDDEQVNAHATPGRITLTLELLKTFSINEISGIIAHECGHIKCDHFSKDQALRKKHSQIMKKSVSGGVIALSALIICVKQSRTNPGDILTAALLGYAIPKLITQSIFFKYSRRCEYEADLAACHNARTAQDLINGLARLHDIYTDPKYEQSPPTTHPATPDRIKALWKHLQSLLAQQSPALAGA